MKLASKRLGRDGQLYVVDKTLTRWCNAADIVPTLQQALDQWQKFEPLLKKRYLDLNDGKIESLPFEPSLCHSPLPRAYHWADGSAYVKHVELVRKARGAQLPESFWHDPLMYQGGSDCFVGPQDNIVATDVAHGIDFEAEVAVITDDVPMNCDATDASNHIKLIMLVNDVSLRNLIPEELAKGFGFYQSKPATAFSPVAVTPDELDPHWVKNKLHLPLVSHLNQKLIGKPNAGIDMQFDFAQLIAHASRTRELCAGSIIGSGTVSNLGEQDVGVSCLAETRMLEKIETGEIQTPFMKAGDVIRIEMFDGQRQSIFGAIEQHVVLKGEQ